ncbi:Pectinesterase, catalytic [Dillenia turbinata]|uniref:pectinesterase n=1 Tax=Dillenia turbinata TaxID=194707 RepID=A0AAN8UIG3_9MAGN
MKEMKEFMAGNKIRRKLFIVALSSLLLVASIISIAVGVTSRNKNSSSRESNNTGGLSQAAHTIVKSSCSSTLYPDLCYSAIAESGEAAGDKPILTQKDVIEKSLNLTTTAVEHNYFAVEKIIKANTHLSKREKTALHDCLETIDETLDELRKAKDDIDRYPNKKSLKQHADDLKTLMSAAMTNQETCLDGFSHKEADKKVRQALLNGEVHVYRMCSNALAMIKNMTDTDIIAQQQQQQRLSSKNAHNAGRKLLLNEEESDDTWPSWLSAGDRKLLQSSTVTPNVVVAADGSGDYKTVTEAVAAAPEKRSKRYVIKIKAGVYKEKVEVSKKKTNIMFVGDGRTNTIITGSLSVKGGSTTFHSATVGQFHLTSLN